MTFSKIAIFLLMTLFVNYFYVQAYNLTLQWDASTSPEVIGYEIWYGNEPSNYTEFVDVGLTTIATLAFPDDTTLRYFAVRAYDSTQVSLFSNEVFYAWAPPVDTEAPLVNITMPSESTVKVKSLATVGADATDNVGVDRVEFYINGSLLCADGLSPYQCTWKVPARAGKDYAITAKAYDQAGNVSMATKTVTSIR